MHLFLKCKPINVEKLYITNYSHSLLYIYYILAQVTENKLFTFVFKGKYGLQVSVTGWSQTGGAG